MSTEAARFSHNPEKIAFLTDSCADLSPKLRKNKPITTTTLNDLCRILGCKVDEILEYVPSPDDQCL